MRQLAQESGQSRDAGFHLLQIAGGGRLDKRVADPQPRGSGIEVALLPHCVSSLAVFPV
jgi:hypothetical protein